MFVPDIMTTNFICSTKDHTIRDVLPMFSKSNANLLPVVNDSQKLIGVITRNKILQIFTTHPSLDLAIDNYCNFNPIFVNPTDSIDDTRSLLLRHNVGHAPVVNNEMVPIGVISTNELLSSYNLVYSQLASVLEIAYDAIILVNKEAKITMVNKGFTDLFGITSKEVINKSTFDLFPELEIEHVINNGVTIKNTPLIIKGQQSLISITPIRANEETVSAICKITFRGLSHLQNALTKVKKLERQLSHYQTKFNELKGTKYTLFDIKGESEAIQKVKNEAFLASKTLSTVLIYGESGTGKELFAQGIHASSLQTGPFIQINCAAIPPELLESEFFGYADGAFTGAKKGGMKGKFELAQNGTIFLDEIGDMPLELQTKILRVLQEREIQPIGSTKTIHLNTKIIAATNQNIENLIAEGKFREDLYYRLNIVRLNIPSLRERIEDLPDIIEVIIDRLNKYGFYIKEVTHSALTKLMKHSWPGNVRELHNILERAANLKSGDYIDKDDIPSFSHTTNNEDAQQLASPYKDRINKTEKEMIIKALEEANGNKTKASKILGISRPWLYAKLKKYHLH